MNSQNESEHISKKRIVYQIPGSDSVTVKRDVPFYGSREGGLLADLYYPPPSESHESRASVIVVAGYPDLGYERAVGCRFKDMGWSVSWARSLAASGWIAITYANREPVRDLGRLLAWLRERATTLELDADRLGLLASSGSGPLALSVLASAENRRGVTCTALAYPYTLDLEGASLVADAAKTYGFAVPSAGSSIDDLPRDLPLFLARAGKDEFPGLNESLDRFAHQALARNFPITLVNHADAPHAFDLFHDSDESREIVKRILGFFRFHLAEAPG